MAHLVAVARVDVPIFVYMFWMCRSAVLAEMKSRSAISRVVRPSATSRKISTSRLVSPPGR